jgi:hypothetical protein
MKERIVQFLKQAGWRGVILSLVLSVLFAPILSVIAHPLLVNTGIYGDPTIEKSVNKLDRDYPAGVTVERFDNISWKEEYDIYRVSLSHEGGPRI